MGKKRKRGFKIKKSTMQAIVITVVQLLVSGLIDLIMLLVSYYLENK